MAFNISLDTDEVAKAHWIAQRLRSSGYLLEQDGSKTRVPGLLPQVRAIGWYMADYNQAQVSFNLLDYTVTSPLQVWLACEQVAAEAGVKLLGSEVIGLLPEQCLLDAGAYQLQQPPETTDKATLVAAATQLLGLDCLKPFDPNEKILEYALAAKGL